MNNNCTNNQKSTSNSISQAAPLDDNVPNSEPQSDLSQQTPATQGLDSSPMTQNVWGRLMPVDAKFSVVELIEKEVSIGRGSTCTVTLPVPQMSSHHCTLHFDEDKDLCFVEDFSTNGTWINKKKYNKCKGLLSHGDEILFVPASKKRGRKKVSFMFQLAQRVKLDEAGHLLTDAFSDKYRVIKTLGAGAFAEVKLVRQRIFTESETDTSSKNKAFLNNIDFAMKEINKDQWEKIKHATAREVSLLDEVKIMQKAGKHKNIVTVIEYFEEKDKVKVIMDFCDGGDMLEYIQSNGSYSNDKARIVFKQITEAMDYLHCELSIAHRDLKPDNLLLCGKESNIIKISDFGISRKSTESMNCQTIIGTPLYQAPEVQLKRYKHKNGYDGKLSDLWSMGVILYIMLVAAPPATEPSDIVKMAENRNLLWYDEPVVETAKDLIYKLLRVNPKQRIRTKEILKHPWVLGFDTKKDYENGQKLKKNDENSNDRKDSEDSSDNNSNNNNNNNNSNNNNNNHNGNNDNSSDSKDNNSNNNNNGNSHNNNNNNSGNNNNGNTKQRGMDYSSNDDSKCDITPSISISMSSDVTPDNKYFKTENKTKNMNNIEKYSDSANSSTSASSSSMRELNEKFSQSQLSSENDFLMRLTKNLKENNSQLSNNDINDTNTNNINNTISNNSNNTNNNNSLENSNNNVSFGGLSSMSSEYEEDDDIDLLNLLKTHKNDSSNDEKNKKCLKRKFENDLSGLNDLSSLSDSTMKTVNDDIIANDKNNNAGKTVNSGSKPPPKKRQRLITAL